MGRGSFRNLADRVGAWKISWPRVEINLTCNTGVWIPVPGCGALASMFLPTHGLPLMRAHLHLPLFPLPVLVLVRTVHKGRSWVGSSRESFKDAFLSSLTARRQKTSDRIEDVYIDL